MRAIQDFAPIVRRRVGRQTRRAYDCTRWGGGYILHNWHGSPPPGAVVINSTTGHALDLPSGRVYVDSRFASSNAC